MDRYICVFDCETVPDADDLRRVYNYSGDDLAVCKRAIEERKQSVGNGFLSVCFHKVVAISAVLASIDGSFKRVSTIEGESERERIAKFLDFLQKKKPLLVSYNGRGFDLPMLMMRAMKYNLNAAAYYDIKDKWSNYRARYDITHHIDLLEQFCEFGATSRMGLNEVCNCLALPGKTSVSGEDVLELFYQNKTAQINEYCESDTLNTYWLFLKFSLLRGAISVESYRFNLEKMSEFLAQKKVAYAEIFEVYLQNELKRLDADFGGQLL